MSQVAIREFDAKSLFAHSTDQEYHGHLIDITQNNRADLFLNSPLAQSGKALVVKPDMLFGKRGKYGLVGVNLTSEQVVERVRSKSSGMTIIKDKTAQLTIFLVEYFVPHTQEYYIALKTERDADVLCFSDQGGVNVEENREKVKEIRLPLGTQDTLQTQISGLSLLPQVESHILDLYAFFVEKGFVYLEVNPFCADEEGNLVNLDMVAKLDSCERFKQATRNTITWTKAFGEENYDAEEKVRLLDEKTGASLKLSLINPLGTIWLLLGGGGASVITMDTLANAGLFDKVANYGELSGNPDYDSNKAYIEQILALMAKNPAPQQYLCMIGGIANFTRIDHLCQAFVKVIEDNLALVQSKNIHIVCRRGGVNDTQGLALVEKFCTQHAIPCQIFDGSVYLTEWVKYINFK